MKSGPVTHNMSGTLEYGVWSSMVDRCTRVKARDYPRYGGRGITVCDQWRTFEGFIADMGQRPSNEHTLERINNDLGYFPGNCRWATNLEQANNKRTNHFVEYRGERMTIAQAVRAAGSKVLRETARHRIAVRGWPVDRAVETPNAFKRDPETRRVVRAE